MNGLYRKRLRPLAFLLPAGGLYALFVHATGLMIPCPFRLITGLKCPGCGMTHMCMSLLRLDFKAAVKQCLSVRDPALLCLKDCTVFRRKATSALEFHLSDGYIRQSSCHRYCPQYDGL